MKNIVMDMALAVIDGHISIDDVPGVYREEVKEQIANLDD